MKKMIIGLILIGSLWFVFAPGPIDPVAWQPPVDKGFVGEFTENTDLLAAELISIEGGVGPEDVAVDAEGRIYGGLHDGRIIRFSADGKNQETFAAIDGGRPLGLHFDAGGNLIVADAWKGLLSISPQGELTVLTTGHGGRPFAFADDLDIGSDGKIYFSDASDTYNQPDYLYDLFEARGHGRLMVYDPATGATDMLLDDLYFANGIALSMNEDFVLVNETGRYRVTRYWLTGDKAGTSDIFVDNLPGFPDGISSNRKGTFWLALPSPRNPKVDEMHPSPFLKNIVAKLPRSTQPGAIKRGTVIGLNELGEVIATYHDPLGAHVYMITSVEQVGDVLYLGSLEAPQIALLDITDQDDDFRDDLIHSDVPLWGYESEKVWPKHLDDGDEIGCVHNIKMGDWKYEEYEEFDSWFRLQNYGAFHCYLIVGEAYDLENLDTGGARYSYLIDLGEFSDKESEVRLWALQLGGRPGSDYILLSSDYIGEEPISSFNVLQRQCPIKNVRKGPSLDSLNTRYCAINSQIELIKLAKAMLKKPFLATLKFIESGQ